MHYLSGWMGETPKSSKIRCCSRLYKNVCAVLQIKNFLVLDGLFSDRIGVEFYMNLESLGRMPWGALASLWLGYALMGWYLAAHHIVWLVGTLVVLTTLAVAWKGVPFFKQLSWSSPRSLLVITITTLALSLCVILFVSDFQFLGLIFLPVVTMFWADLEMRSADFNRPQILLNLAMVSGLGIGLGETIAHVIIPSMR
jgi:hypothetical protein